ncbi:hypothetical protein ACH4VX_34325 [Streptomyces sp. NPDC020731]|uniref:hypothetical protein n=1 Tax=Streptomyces sp. NPDC020731 TaxID=3365085 RepID=UPI0037B1B314
MDADERHLVEDQAEPETRSRQWPGRRGATTAKKVHQAKSAVVATYPIGMAVIVAEQCSIEPILSSIGLRAEVARGSDRPAAALAMVFKLVESDQERWRAIPAQPVALVRAGAVSVNGELVERPRGHAA